MRLVVGPSQGSLQGINGILGKVGHISCETGINSMPTLSVLAVRKKNNEPSVREVNPVDDERDEPDSTQTG